jgi:rhomboid protease GluP
MDERRMCPHCRAFITSRDKVCPYCNERVGPRAAERRDPGAILGGFIPHARFVTMIILVINFGLFLATVIFSQGLGQGGGFMSVDQNTLIAFGGKLRGLIFGYGEWWRLVTAGFLHGGLLHIGMNSWVLFDLGAQVEEVYGPSRLIVVYFLGTVFGFLLSCFLSPGSLSVGASAGIMGLIGAMIALGVRERYSSAAGANRGMYIRWAVYMIILGLLPGLHIDNGAHIGGLAAGFGVAWLAGTPRIETAWSERLWRAAAAACVLITALCFLKMYLWFTHNVQ